ncbi:MAG TPA: helix-turn-helix domain-containing protein [Streptosporangiaceae bacterium]|nr:helix-turn-helix domain-containing protein [Streptosporangiaceae bacterium]
MAEPITGPDEPDQSQLELVTILAALADPVRLAYVREVARSGPWVRCGEVLANTGITISKSTLSHHLRVLREAGLTNTRIEGARRYISLRFDEVDARFPGLLSSVCGVPSGSHPAAARSAAG